MQDSQSTTLRRKVWTPLIVILILIIGIGIGIFIQPFINKSRPLDKYIDREDPLDEIISLINQEYVDDISKDTLYMDAVNGILNRLDPHTVYIPSSQLAQANEILEGSGKGIGIDYFFYNDTLLVTALEQGGPAEKADLKIGDRIISVNGKRIAGLGATEEMAINAFRTTKSDSLMLQVARANFPKPINVFILKDILQYNSVNSSYMLEDGVTGYIKMSIFSSESYNDFAGALESLVKAGMKNLIYDLRGNTGGYLTEAVSIADEFLNKEKLIVYTKDKRVGRDDYNASIDGLFEKGKLIILIDDNSASASEVVAGAIQDWDRGLVVGIRSFGKGLIQEQYELSDGSALRLTTSRYYTPIGRSIQRPYNNESRQEYFNHENKDEISTNSDEVFYTFNNKRKLYGNGGITPDFIISSAEAASPSLVVALKNNFVEIFSNDYYFKVAKDSISNMKMANFVTSYEVSDKTIQAFKEFLLKNNAMLSNDIMNNKNDLVIIKKMIKSQFAKLAFGKQAYYQVQNQKDSYITEAKRLLYSSEYDRLLSGN